MWADLSHMSKHYERDLGTTQYSLIDRLLLHTFFLKAFFNVLTIRTQELFSPWSVGGLIPRSHHGQHRLKDGL